MDDLDRDLAAVLGVDPSVEFRARVRERIARESMASPWRLFGPRFVPVAAATVVVVVAGMYVFTGPQGPGPAVAIPRQASTAGDIVLPAPVAAVAPPPSTAPRRIAVANPSSAVVAVTARHEVLLSESERAGVRLLFQAIAEDRLELPDDVLAPATAPIAAIQVPPITIEALSIAGTGEDQ
jgi:hypothetical protein